MIELNDFDYSPDELAWITPFIHLQRDIYLRIELKEKGKVVIRQKSSDGKLVRVPIKRHKDTDTFEFRISIIPKSMDIKIFTSTEPKSIRYAYI